MAGVCRYVCLCLFVYIISDVDGESIKVHTIEDPPYVTYDSEKSGNARFTGFIPDLMKAIADKKNIDYAFDLVADNKYGTKQSNGKWNGLIGEVNEGTADVAAAPITISDERKTAVDFSESYMRLGTVVLVSNPEDGEAVGINSVKDLASQTAIQYGIVKDGITQAFFENSNDEDYQKMWEYLRQNSANRFNQNSNGVDKVRRSNGKFAFIMENTTAAYYAQKEPCDLAMVGEPINLKDYAFAINKGQSSIKAKIDAAINALKSNGKITELQNKWWDERSECKGSAVAASFSGLLLVSIVLFKLLL